MRCNRACRFHAFRCALYLRAENELTKSIASIKKDISAAQSENVSLNSELEALVSVSQIDSYAVEKLGMTRVQDNNVKYIDSAEYDAAQSAQNSDTE